MGGTRSIDWREQIELIIDGRQPRYLPAVFRMSRWYKARTHRNSLPAELAGMSLAQIEDYLGLARSARYAKICRVEFRSPVERLLYRDGELVVTEYRTPRGDLRRIARFGPGDETSGIDPTLIEYPVKSWKDYAALAEVFRHMEFVPTYDEYNRYDRQIGRAGMPMVIIGAIPFHYVLQEWTGYEKGYLDLHDRPDVFLEAVEAGNQAYVRMWEVAASSPARLLLHGINFDRQMTPPPLWRQHWLDYLSRFTREMHLHGKKVVFHADGDMSGLLELMLEADLDVADCFACHPLVPCTVAQAREVWKDRITIWGGLPSTLLEPGAPIDALLAHLDDLRKTVHPGKRFILGLTDMAMPTTSWDHLLAVRDWLVQHRDWLVG